MQERDSYAAELERLMPETEALLRDKASLEEQLAALQSDDSATQLQDQLRASAQEQQQLQAELLTAHDAHADVSSQLQQAQQVLQGCLGCSSAPAQSAS